MCFGGESYWSSLEAMVAVEQRGSVQVVVNRLCSGREVKQAQILTSMRTDDATINTEAKV